MDDKVSKGRQARGVNTPHAKLTEEKVRQMRELHASGTTQIKLSHMFGIKKRAVYDVVYRKTWKQVA